MSKIMPMAIVGGGDLEKVGLLAPTLAPKESMTNSGFAINHALVMADRERVGRDASPSAATIDSQSVKTTEAGGRAHDAGKSINGRKRHAPVDTDGRGHMSYGGFADDGVRRGASRRVRACQNLLEKSDTPMTEPTHVFPLRQPHAPDDPLTDLLRAARQLAMASSRSKPRLISPACGSELGVRRVAVRSDPGQDR